MPKLPYNKRQKITETAYTNAATFQMNPDKVYLTDAEYEEMTAKIKANL